MILAFSFSDIIRVPFGYLMSALYQLTSNYGVALILFGILVKLILLPATAKGKRSTMKMSRLSPRLNAIKEKYPDDQTKQSQAIQALYKEEGVSMTGGCLWSLIPLFLLFPLYRVVQQPIVYMLHESAEVVEQIIAVIKEGAASHFSDNAFYDQMIAAPLIPQFADKLKDIVANPETLEGVNFTFLGIDLAKIPTFNITKWDSFSWANIGAFLLPVLSAGTQFVSMLINQNMNNSLVTDERGLEDKETAKNSQASQQGKTMMYTMPLVSLWIGFTFPAAICLYWIVQGVISTVIDVILTKKYRKIYDEEDAIRLEKALAADALEAEKERIRAQKRAANPDGITENTSKKKLQQAQKREQEAAKREAAKEYAIKKGILTQEEIAEADVPSGDPSRPYCKGRAYDPNRYASRPTEE